MLRSEMRIEQKPSEIMVTQYARWEFANLILIKLLMKQTSETDHDVPTLLVDGTKAKEEEQKEV